jgi:hypothetical protein
MRITNSAAGAAFVLALTCYPAPILSQVGATPGEFEVTDGGEATYSIPITGAPGVGGLAPELKLRYKSNGVNGLFGVGWALSGISSITRCPKTPAEDGARVGVLNNSTDLFCLDGSKLRAVSGSYGAPATQYRTSLDTYGRITSLGNVAGGPQSFTLETKEGKIYTFGGSDSSRLLHPSKGVIRTWMVSEIKDRFTNRISFTYSNNLTLGEQLLTQVAYNNGKIELVYEARPTDDPINKYDDGVQYGSTNSRVSRIEIYDEPTINGTKQYRKFKEYRIGYVQSQASRRSLISSIQECGATNECLPTLAMQYRSERPAAAFIRSHTVGGAAPFYLSDKDGTGKLSVLSVPFYFIDGNITYGPFLAWDIDGNMKTDTYRVYVTGNRFTPAKKYQEFRYDSGQITQQEIQVSNSPVVGCFGDFLGNGKSNTVTIQPGFTRSTRGGDQYVPPAAFISSISGSIALTGNPTTCRSIDVDGDGKMELLISNLVYTINPGALVHRGSIGGSTSVIGFGDLNGDGKDDYVGYTGNQLTPYFSSGAIVSWIAGSPVSYIQGLTPIQCFADFNGDGRTDVLAGTRVGGNGRLFLSTGTSFVEVPSGLPNSGAFQRTFLCGDINGDGSADVFESPPSDNFLGEKVVYYSAFGGAIDRLIQIDNGVGYVQRVDYKSITDDSVYTKGSGAVYPLVDVQTPIQVVSQVRSGNDAQGWKTTSHRYAELRKDLLRSGTLGFGRVASRNESTGISTAAHYNQTYPLTGFRSRVHLYLGTDSAPQTLENTTFSYFQRGIGVAAPTPQAAQVHLSEVNKEQFDLRQSGVKLGSVKEITDNFDTYGSPARQRIEYYDGSGVLTSFVNQDHVYSNDVSRWLLGRLVRTTTSQENLRSLPTTVAAPTPPPPQ